MELTNQQKVKLLSDKVQRVASFHAWIMVMNTALLFLFGSMAVFVTVSFVSIFMFGRANRDSWKQFGVFGGYANLVTGLRYLILLLLCLLNSYSHNYVLFGFTLLVTIADGFDGYLARKYKTSSVFGEYFDSETDAFFVLSVTAVLFEKGMAGSWILLPGLLRYVYVIAISFLKYPHYSNNAGTFRRRFIGSFLMGCLIACFVLSPVIYIPAMVIAYILVTFSFIIDFVAHVARMPAKAG